MLTDRLVGDPGRVAQPIIAGLESGRVTPRVAHLSRLLAACGFVLEPMSRPAGGRGHHRNDRKLNTDTAESIRTFDNLEATARQIDLSGAKVKVASLDDLIAMKRAAGRTKDLLELENLGALREVLDENPDLSI